MVRIPIIPLVSEIVALVLRRNELVECELLVSTSGYLADVMQFQTLHKLLNISSD